MRLPRSKVIKVVDKHGTAVILKNNIPRYYVIDFSKAENFSYGETEKVASSEYSMDEIKIGCNE